ncbi:Alpha/Beta hydrolase protein [Elsinoe ampelina]|uniref:Alpha/Beta hydrolase protein n=1 Tax=Elsinoe ampelina TaxID=302913 RepID=A0A6A6G322_9PEZI|nr:Alpha/Beta hydrolase protein [Elsinoe ampelina]
MRFQAITAALLFMVVGPPVVSATPITAAYNLKSFKVDLRAGVHRMKALSKDTRLPEEPQYPGLGGSAGIDLDVLKSFRDQLTYNFNWAREERQMNSFKQYTAIIEGLTTHFIHEKSPDPNAIPLLLGHGWPGSFLEFLPIVKNLTRPAKTSSGKPISFHVIIPSLPGFAFSQSPPSNWSTDDTGRLWNTLMTQVLQYPRYAVHGTDFGSAPTYSMYDAFPTSVGAAHFVFLPFNPLTPTDLAAQNLSIAPLEPADLANSIEWAVNGSAYYALQGTKPNTLGLALHDNPVGQLAWLAEKFLTWSDPRQGTGASVLTPNEILRSAALYFLSRTFLSSTFIYFQNRGFRTNYTRARTQAPLLFSAFRYNVGFWPADVVAKLGNLVSYEKHDFGGHFPGLDNPEALTGDLRDIREYWSG